MTTASMDGAGLAKRLIELAAELGSDELRLLLVLAERLALGERRYGPFELTRDTRDFHRECLEECADGLVYVAAALLRQTDVHNRARGATRNPGAA